MNKAVKLGILGAILLSLFGWLFFLVALEPDWLQQFDQMFAQLPQWRSPKLEVIFQLLAFTATVVPAISIHLICAVYLFLSKKRFEGIWVMTNLFLISGMGQIIKKVVARPRPLFEGSIERTSFSFPSGHTLLATTIFITLLFVIQVSKTGVKPRHMMNRALFTMLGGVYVLAIVCSRLILGVHYPSDLLASLLLANGMSLSSYAIALYIKQVCIGGSRKWVQ